MAPPCIPIAARDFIKGKSQAPIGIHVAHRKVRFPPQLSRTYQLNPVHLLASKMSAAEHYIMGSRQFLLPMTGGNQKVNYNQHPGMSYSPS